MNAQLCFAQQQARQLYEMAASYEYAIVEAENLGDLMRVLLLADVAYRLEAKADSWVRVSIGLARP